ncbi:MAG: tetratricopeptide repeat protein [Gemmataceae bacterium]|nr:tetratricopeptide repeat protein [Gemmataceae bacterium]MDW8264619.1 tetratricopeptide repeat protein [Gemmataceae bacterium]
MGLPLLVEWFNELPDAAITQSLLAPGEAAKALARFHRRVSERYAEGTLQRLLHQTDARTREAAVLALSVSGSMKSNKLLIGRLGDANRRVRQLAQDALWAIWFRAAGPACAEELQRLRHLRDRRQALPELTALIRKAPRFAEAYNQRALMYFHLGQYPQAIADCERALKLNPFHFGAYSGMAQCYMKLNRPRAALRAFRAAYRLNPNLEGILETIRALEDAIGSDGHADPA